ncbi:MAG: hypothetical protein RR685_02290 [Hungatella sp.]
MERIVIVVRAIAIAIVVQTIVTAVKVIVIANNDCFMLQCQGLQTKVGCSLEKVMRSKFLWVMPSKENENFLVIHERNHTAVEVTLDVIDIIDQYVTPQIPSSEDRDEQELYRLLTEIHFLHNKIYMESESHDILNNWLCRFEKETKSFQYQNITAIYAAREEEPIHEILIEILKIGQELNKEFLSFQHALYVLFLTPWEYRSIQREFNIPSDISAFVDSRTLLIVDYESYFHKNNTSSFYPTIRHEFIHVLFGQYAYYLPFWIEEGLCEYYSNKYRVDSLNDGLREESLISFLAIHSEKVNYISQLSIFETIQHVFYSQAVSFLDFLFRKFSTERIWSMIQQSSIRRDFFDVLEIECGITLMDLQIEWESFIKQ